MSFPYKRILCPVDFDDNSALAMKEASALARHLKAALCLLHVVWINPLAAEGFMLAELQESQSRDARMKLSEMATRELGGGDYQIYIEIGDPAEKIFAMERQLNADLVVMATHGRRGVRRLMLGSVAEKVVRESIIPVLTIRTQVA